MLWNEKYKQKKKCKTIEIQHIEIHMVTDSVLITFIKRVGTLQNRD